MDEVTKARLELEQSIFTTPEIIQRELEVFLSKTVAKATEMTKRSHAGGEQSAVHCGEAGDLAAVILTAMANHGKLSTGTVVAAVANVITILGVASRSAPQTQTLAETMTMTVALLEM